MDEYIKKLEKENEHLNRMLRSSSWFHGIGKIKEPHLNYIESHPKCIIQVGWFWFTEQGPNIVKEIDNSLETITKPLMCNIMYDNKNNWILYDNGKYGQSLDAFKNFWFAGPLIPPYRDLLDE